MLNTFHLFSFALPAHRRTNKNRETDDLFKNSLIIIMSKNKELKITISRLVQTFTLSCSTAYVCEHIYICDGNPMQILSFLTFVIN